MGESPFLRRSWPERIQLQCWTPKNTTAPRRCKMSHVCSLSQAWVGTASWSDGLIIAATCHGPARMDLVAGHWSTGFRPVWWESRTDPGTISTPQAKNVSDPADCLVRTLASPTVLNRSSLIHTPAFGSVSVTRPTFLRMNAVAYPNRLPIQMSAVQMTFFRVRASNGSLDEMPLERPSINHSIGLPPVFRPIVIKPGEP